MNFLFGVGTVLRIFLNVVWLLFLQHYILFLTILANSYAKGKPKQR